MEQFLTNKTALVTGGTRGIGRAIAESLLRSGARVTICGRSSDGVDAAVREMSSLGDIRGVAADISKWDDAARLFDNLRVEYGGLDILINNAGVGIFKSVKEMSREEWHQVIDLNLSGVFYCCHLAIPLLSQKDTGYIIDISSLAGKNPFAGGAAYNASKFGLNGFSEALMQDVRHDGIRVSYVMPGSVDTDFSTRSGRASWKIAPGDIAEIVLCLLRMPQRTLVSRVEVRPSRPPK
jgi:NAD(P)-dependent dehydrogenase (short-subunit alcohol dehydrogenase family)